MKIAMMSRWNVTCGVSLHGELVGREWARQGYDLTLLAPSAGAIWLDDREYCNSVRDEDEEYVRRAYGEPESYDHAGWINESIFEQDFDVLVIQALKLAPISPLLKVWDKIKAKKVHVFHEGELPDFQSFYNLNFDAIACFDHRYVKMLTPFFPAPTLKIIPYPCHPVMTGDKAKARKKLGIPDDKVVFFSFGMQLPDQYEDYLSVLGDLSKDYDIEYIVIRSDQQWGREVPPFMKLIKAAPSVEKIYDYLHAADACLIPKPDTDDVVVSSTVFMCLGSLCPIVFPDNKYVELMDQEIVKYKDREHMKVQLRQLIEEEDFGRKISNEAAAYVQDNSAPRIARQFIDLFERL